MSFPRARGRLCFAVVLWSLIGQGLPARAAGVGTAEAAVVVSRSVPAVLGLGKRVLAIPKDIADILRLPLGAVQMVCAPLPGISFVSGLRNVGAGVVAPFQLVVDVMSLPHELVCGVMDVAGSASPLPIP